MAWSQLDEERLKRIYRVAKPCENSEEFIRKLSELFKGKTVGSIREKCRRMQLEPKVNPKDEMCEFCGQKLAKNEPTTKNMHKNCYTKKWRIDNL